MAGGPPGAAVEVGAEPGFELVAVASVQMDWLGLIVKLLTSTPSNFTTTLAGYVIPLAA